jgi:hypothetical protein
MRVSARSRNLVYRGISQDGNHRGDRVPRPPRNATIGALRNRVRLRGQHKSASRPGQTQLPAARCAAGRQINDVRIGQSGASRNIGGGAKERGRRRTRQDQISRGSFETPVKLRTIEIRTERRKLVSSAGPVFEKSELS